MENKIEHLWNQLRPINKETWPERNFTMDPNEYRFDSFGAIVKKDEQNKQTEFGWTIDHVFPVSKGGDNNILNLEILHWENNQKKGNDFPLYGFVVSRNIDTQKFGNYSAPRMRLKCADEVISHLSTIYPQIYNY